MDQILLLGFFIIVAVFYFVNILYQDQIKKKYHNFEHWREIKLKARSVSMSYIEIVTLILAILFVGLPITFSFSIKISVERLSMIAFNLVMLKSMVEYFALRYFNKL